MQVYNREYFSVNYTIELEDLLTKASNFATLLEEHIKTEQNPVIRLILRATLTSSSDPYLKKTIGIDQLLSSINFEQNLQQSIQFIVRVYTDLISHKNQMRSLQAYSLYSDICLAYLNLLASLKEILIKLQNDGYAIDNVKLNNEI